VSAPGDPSRAVLPLLVALLVVTFGLRVATGAAVLDHTYHFDERYSFRNVSALLVEGTSRPANAFYPSLSYLPQTAVLAASAGLHRVTGIEGLAVFDQGAADGYSRTAYLLVRLVAALFGTLGVWLTFVLGRRMFDARIGLLAATLLSAVPSHVSHSALFKPDILVVLLVTLAFLWSRDAVHAPRAGRYLLVGFGVGLAVAAKYTGVAAALPVAAGSAVAGWRDRRLWLWLVAAAGVSFAAFAILNPHFGTVLAYLPRLWRIYGTKGEAVGGSHLAVLGEEASFLVRNHQLPVVLFALVGLGWAGSRVLRRDGDDRLRLDALMLLAIPLGYSLLYAISTTLFMGQNFLLVTPFSSLLAAWPMVAVWDRARAWLRASRPRVGASPWLAAAVWTAVTAAILVTPVRAVYRAVVPTTFERAERILADPGPVERRIAYFEREDHRLQVRDGTHRMVTFPVAGLDRVPEEELRLADAEVFFARRLGAPEAPFYWRRLATAGVRAQRIEARLFHARGPGLVVLTHPWEPSREPSELVLGPGPGRNRFRVELPSVGPEERVSFGVWMPLDRSGPRPETLRVGRQELPLFETGVVARRLHATTLRAEAHWRNGETTLALEERLDLRWTPRVTLYRWRAPGTGEAPGGAGGG
jgi:hypothetical protein